MNSNFEIQRKMPHEHRNIVGIFVRAFGNTEVISVRCQLPLCFVFVSSFYFDAEVNFILKRYFDTSKQKEIIPKRYQ